MVKKLIDMIMGNNAHSQLDSLIEQNKRNPQNIKNEVMTETIKIPKVGLTDYLMVPDKDYYKGYFLGKSQTESGEPRYHVAKERLGSSYAIAPGTREQVMHLALKSMMESPQDTIPAQALKDYFMSQSPKNAIAPKALKNYLGEDFYNLYKKRMSK
tara:strand:- start:53 stop:520 length:468 start_codon:yes stop_codon:yes gene_type:complete